LKTAPKMLGSTADYVPTWEPTPLDWAAIEAAFRSPIDQAARAKLCAVVEAYMTLAVAERSAPPIALVRQALSEINGSVRKLLDCLAFRDDDPARSDALGQLQSYLDEALAAGHPVDAENLPLDCHQLWKSLLRVGEACTAVEASLIAEQERGGGWAKGDAWRGFIAGAALFFEGCGIKPTASKTNGLAVAESRFVSFVRAVQETLPAFQEHAQSGHFSDEVAKALSAVRRAQKAAGEMPHKT
jgi:hypothetical protein